ncbi:MAG: hypothetical protein OEU94_11555, partial [Aquincola sp.]|nr:hypothetical protein [Aquincola sp.]
MNANAVGRIAARALSSIRVVAFLMLCLAGSMAPEAALAQAGAAAFDHQTTGFPLTGLHQDVRCETCHIKGIFKSTPRDCATCHVQNNPRSAVAKPVNHLPTAQGCDTCHTTSTFGGARFDHVMAMPGSCASCHNNVVTTGKAASHIATAASCDQCHSTISFATIRVPSNHIPVLASARCESCHVGIATGSSFAGAQMDHTGYAGNCGQCHAPAVASTFYGVQIKSSLTAPPHIPASDNCESCHTAPTMLIPVTGAASVGGTTFAGGRMSHAGITSNCVLCHGPTVTAGTFMGVTPKTNVGLSPPHLPSSDNCEFCHANAIPAQPIPATGTPGVTFANGQMNHAGITSGCANCHGPSITGASFYGVSSIVVMPPTSPVGPTSHIPSGTNCEQCHLASVPAGPIAAVATRTAPGTGFATPAPTGPQIHAGLTSGCNACHEAGYSWMGMSAYPISPAVLTPNAQYRGFHTRPRPAAGPYNVADASHPTTRDCSECHSNTSYFTAQDKPANHIPTAASAQCNACHTTSDYSVMPTLANIHANAPSTTGNCAQCHGAAAPSFAIPANNFS